MKLADNPFVHGLSDGQPQLGLWIALSSPFSAEVVASAGFDWALIDMEHSPNDYFSVLGQLQAFAATSTTAIVRPQWNDPVIVKRLLDLGVQGLLFPMIQSVEEARAAVAATRYPPRGIRGVSGATRGSKFGRISDYFERVADETAVLVQLETINAIDQADEIAAVDGVSGVFFGPADIAADMGKVGKATDPAVWELIRKTAHKLISNGVPVGTLVQNADFAAELVNDGFSFVACGLDTVLLARASDTLIADVRKKLK